MSTSAVQANRRNGQTGCRMRSGHREGYCRVCFISIWAGNKNCQSVPGSSKINGRIKSEREKKKRKNKKETSCSIAAPLCSRSFHLPGYVDSNADAEQLIVTIVTIHRESKKEKKNRSIYKITRFLFTKRKLPFPWWFSNIQTVN